MIVLSDACEEARRSITAADRGLTLRQLGGLADGLHSPGATQRALRRTDPDSDFMSTIKRVEVAEKLPIDLG